MNKELKDLYLMILTNDKKLKYKVVTHDEYIIIEAKSNLEIDDLIYFCYFHLKH